MNIKNLCYIVVAALSVGCGSAQEENREPQQGVTSINGRVVDRVTSAPIQGVRVSTSPPTSEDITNSDGKFLLTDRLVPDTLYTVVASATGYSQDTASATVLDGENKVVNFNLQPTLSNGLLVSPSDLNFGASTSNLQINISSQYGEAMDFVINQPDDAWLSIQEPFSGALSTQSVARVLTVSREGLEPGRYSTTFNVTSNTGSVVVVTARLVVE